MDHVFILTQTIKSLLILAVANGTGTIKNAYLAQTDGSSTIKECAFLTGTIKNAYLAQTDGCLMAKECAFLFPINAKLLIQMVHAYLAGKDTT